MSTKSVIGASGEYYVAAFLSANGLVVALPRGGTPATDLIVTQIDGGKAISIQVKTGTQSHSVSKRKSDNNCWLWDTGEKAINISDDSHWYVYVHLNDWPATADRHPDLFFVPSKIVADHISKNIEEVKAGFAKRGTSGNIRPYFIMTEPEAEQYRGILGFRRFSDQVGFGRPASESPQPSDTTSGT